MPTLIQLSIDFSSDTDSDCTNYVKRQRKGGAYRESSNAMKRFVYIVAEDKIVRSIAQPQRQSYFVHEQESNNLQTDHRNLVPNDENDPTSTEPKTPTATPPSSLLSRQRIVLNPLRIRFESIQFQTGQNVKIAFALIDPFEPIYRYEIYAYYDTFVHGVTQEQSKRIARIAAEPEKCTMTVKANISSVDHPREKLRFGIRAIGDIYGPIAFSDNVAITY